MFIAPGPQPAGTLVVAALHQGGAYAQIEPLTPAPEVVGLCDCNDDRSIHGEKKHLRQFTGSSVLMIPQFGGVIRLSSWCPSTSIEGQRFIVDEMVHGVQLRQVPFIFAGCHGEHCGWCDDEGVTVAQRHWLAIDGFSNLMRHLETDRRTVGLKVRGVPLYHRKVILSGAVEAHRTRAINWGERVFHRLSLKEIIGLSDKQVLERIAPQLLERAAVA